VGGIAEAFDMNERLVQIGVAHSSNVGNVSGCGHHGTA
jgi:phage shock protein PspC (stress-responsive transcriptional regulator)